MTSRDEILEFADDFLAVREFTDYCPNGLQVFGADEVTHIATAVSCSVEVFERVVASGAQLLLTHHGLFWRDTPQVIDAHARRRLKLLLDNDVTLAGYHLPLDAHPEVGNNALILDGLGLTRTDDRFAVAAGRSIGAIGAYEQAVPFHEFFARVEDMMGQPPLHLGPSPDLVRRVAVCSGGGDRYLDEAISAGVDVMVSGEPGEPTMALAHEGDVAFIAAGHYASEVFGIRRLGELLADRFGVVHTFHHVPNPV